MNKYVVAFWSDHTGELLQEIVEANSQHEAACKYLQIDPIEFPSLVDTINYAVNGDSMINVLEIKDRNWRKFATDPGSITATMIQ
jgi:hypothetical protein